MPPPSAVLRVTAADRPGLVADLAGLIYRLGVNIVHADQHKDPEQGSFFQRVEFTLPDGLAGEGRAAFAGRIGEACQGWGMRWSLRFADERRRVAILVSKGGHCALDLLQRHRAGELPCEIPFVLSNHAALEEEVVRRGYAFVHEPIDGDRPAQEERIRARLRAERIDLVVLARYMQILSPAFVESWPERIINIHHSFLPAFAGADPYRQAHRRGVKLIGATSHYVTSELDEGPIISQDVARVGHRDTVEDMVRKGRDLERIVLAHAVRCHLEDRVIGYANRTVVFE
jgi:formyltetrahydrofolate deformylase